MTQQILTQEQIADLFSFAPETIKAINSYYGTKALFCRQCNCYHEPAWNVLGRYVRYGQLVIADITVSAEGHTLRDDSH